MLTVLGGLAEFERELIRARTGEGRNACPDRGVRFGRPRKLTPHQRQEAVQRRVSGETQADIARTYNVDATTIGRLSPTQFVVGMARAEQQAAEAARGRRSRRTTGGCGEEQQPTWCVDKTGAAKGARRARLQGG